MREGTIGLVKGDPKKIVQKIIMDVTDSEFSHTRIYILGWTIESTVWKVKGKLFPRSGIYLTRGIVPSDLYLSPKVAKTPAQAEAGLVKAIELVNSRAWYAYLLTLFDIILFPTRGLWKWIYKKTGWAPFTSSRTNCSYVVDLLEKTMGLDLWPKMPESLTVPGDYPDNKFLEKVA
jgi:hypothetical protein